MTPSKRLFDIIIAFLLGVVLLPLLLVVAAAILIRDGRPVFFLSERMRTPTQSFKLIKFRTMRPADDDCGVNGGHKLHRVTALGAFLRQKRLDEVPQLWNILRGDISLVGPRPPLRRIVERFPDTYAQVLKSTPGVTGLASVIFHAHEERLMAPCTTPDEADAVYARACVPRKARLDLIYQANQSIWLDLRIMWKSAFRRTDVRCPLGRKRPPPASRPARIG